MQIQLIQGRFSSEDAVELITRLIQSKIAFHEEKIHHTDMEEDIKFRENRIKNLQKSLSDLRDTIRSGNRMIDIDSSISVTNI